MHFEPAFRALELPPGIRAHALLDVGARRAALPRKAVGDEPARALRHMPAHQEDAEAQHPADGEREPPADIGRNTFGSRKMSEAPEPATAPTQKLPLMMMSMRPR